MTEFPTPLCVGRASSAIREKLTRVFDVLCTLSRHARLVSGRIVDLQYFFVFRSRESAFSPPSQWPWGKLNFVPATNGLCVCGTKPAPAVCIQQSITTNTRLWTRVLHTTPYMVLNLVTGRATTCLQMAYRLESVWQSLGLCTEESGDSRLPDSCRTTNPCGVLVCASRNQSEIERACLLVVVFDHFFCLET